MSSSSDGPLEEPEKGDQEVQLAGRHRLIVRRTERGDAVQLLTPDGAAPLTIEITSAGVRIQLAAPSVALETQGDLTLSADHLTLHGRKGLALTSGGDLDLAAKGDLHSTAQAQVLRAEQGEVNIKASDDVRVSGERVMVNCDETIDYFRPKPG